MVLPVDVRPRSSSTPAFGVPRKNILALGEKSSSKCVTCDDDDAPSSSSKCVCCAMVVVGVSSSKCACCAKVGSLPVSVAGVADTKSSLTTCSYCARAHGTSKNSRFILAFMVFLSFKSRQGQKMILPVGTADQNTRFSKM